MPKPRTVEDLAGLLGVTVEEAEDDVLAHAYAADLAAADADLAAGRTVDLEDALAEVGDDDGG